MATADEVVEGDALGPFDPPADYRFEDELIGEPPRPRPEILARGRHAARQRSAVSGLLIAAAIATACGLLPFVQVMGLYFLPLAYITWIGIGLGALGVVIFVSQRTRRGPYQYAEEGVPLVARIRGLELRPSSIVNGQEASHRFVALVEFLDPETDEIRIVEASSNEIGAGSKASLTTTYRVGDYVTAVYLPVDLARSFRLYGFLDLRPDLGLVRRDSAGPGGLFQLALKLGAAFGIFGALGWNVYAFGKFAPMEMGREQLVPMAVGAVLIGGAALGLIRSELGRNRARRAEQNARAVALGEFVETDGGVKQGWFGSHHRLMDLVIIAGMLLLGGLTTLCWADTANALLDTSPPILRVVQVDRLVSVTHNWIFREYKVEYHFIDGDPEKREYLSTPSEMDQLVDGIATAEIHAGRLGWPWVKALRPIRFDLQPDLPAEDDGPPGVPRP